MEQKITQQSGNRAVYEAPKAEVIEIKPQGILCASGNPLESYPGTGW